MTAAPRIETDRLVLRPHRMEDFAAMAAFFASDAAGFVGGPMPAPRAWHRFAADVGSWDLLGFGAWAIEEKATGAFAGQVGAEQAAALPRARDRLAGPSRLRGTRLRRRGRPRRPRLRLRHARLGDRRELHQPRQQPLDRARPPPGLHRGPGRRAALPLGHRVPPPRPGGAPMTRSDAIRRAADLLRGHRKSIDRLDAILVFTLAERFKHTQAVGVLKAEHGLPPSDPAREVGADRPAGAAGGGGGPRSGVRAEIPELHHLGSDQASREASRERAAGPQPHRKETDNGHEDPARPRRVQEASALFDRRRRQPLRPRRPLHREARHLRSAAAQGQRGPGEDRPRAGAVLARPGRAGDRPGAALPRGGGRHREEGAQQPEGGRSPARPRSSAPRPAPRSPRPRKRRRSKPARRWPVPGSR